MNVVVTIFYVVAICYLFGLLGFSFYKKWKQKKAEKNVKKQIEEERKKADVEEDK